ncbi:MAG: uracil-DNA glycosylase [Cypionkella sp.]
MGIAEDIADDWHAALAALAWQVELGVDEIIGEAALNRYELPPPPKLPEAVPLPVRAPAVRIAVEAGPGRQEILAEAEAAAARAGTLEELRAEIAGFAHCEIKQGARNMVFGDGNAKARVLILGEAPSVEEDREGRPFVGRSGDMLDRMFAAIGLERGAEAADAAFYATTVLPWRTPQTRDPLPAEIEMMRPFVARHIALVDPAVVVLMGNVALLAGTGATGITAKRGTWLEAFGKPALPMLHPEFLMRMPLAKREAWADLLALKARLREV